MSRKTQDDLAAQIRSTFRARTGAQALDLALREPSPSPQTAKDVGGTPQESEKQEPKTAKEEQADRCTYVWRKLRDDSELHRDALPGALNLLGFVAPRQALIDEVYVTITSYNQLSLEDFVKFVAGYTIRLEEALAEAYRAADTDHSGRIESEELAELLTGFGIMPMRHVLEEVIAEVDEDGGGELDFNEFKKVMELINGREGFTRKDHDSIMGVFRRFDRDGSGELDGRELATILNWLGYMMSPQQIADVVASVDSDGSGSINEREFLLCMKLVRDNEVKKVIKLIEEVDEEGDGFLDTFELDHILRSLGYVPDADAVDEAVREAGFNPGDKLDLSMFWQVLGIFRSREGFAPGDSRELAEAMKRFDENGDGEIAVLQVGKLLRSLGYALPILELQSYVERVDVDGSGALDYGEMRKLVRMLREKAMFGVMEVFLEQCRACSVETLSQLQVNKALQKLGLINASTQDLATITDQDLPRRGPESPHAAKAKREVDLIGFARIFARLERCRRAKNKDQCGFSSKEVLELEHLFRKYDPDTTGIRAQGQIRLIEDCFPEMAHDRDSRPQLLTIMEEVMSDKNAGLSFPDFLHLLQKLVEMQDQSMLKKEQQVVKEAGFSVPQIRGFRELFLKSGDGSGELTLEEVREMMNNITPIGDKNYEELRKLFNEVAGMQRGCEGNRDKLDFAEFLMLISRLLSTNFANILDKTRGACTGGFD